MKLLGFVLSLIILAATAGIALAAPGDLDPSFDGDGQRVVDLGGGDYTYSVAVQPDGKIVLVGTGAANQFTVTRLNVNGSLDTGFGGDGSIDIDFPGRPSSVAYDVAIQPDGKIVVVGTAATQYAIARLNPNGTPDNSFNGNGRLSFGSTSSDETFTGITIQPDGKYLLAGNVVDNSIGCNCVIVMRMLPDGNGDTSFAPGTPFFDGQVWVDFPGTSEFATELTRQPDGKVVVVGSTGGGAPDFAAARVNASGGTLDSSFDGDGKWTNNLNQYDIANDVVVQPDGKTLIAGYTSGATSQFAVLRLNTDGSFDSSYSGQGRLIFTSSGRADSIALQANGKAIIAGTIYKTGDNDFWVSRLQPGGELDTTFDSDGVKTVSFSGADTGNALALGGDGKIVVAGTASNANIDLAVARLEGDPPSAGGGPAGGPGGGGGGSGSGKPPRCAGKRATILGNHRSNRLRGTKKADVIVGLGGNDRISGLRGNDRICGGEGRDRISGGAGNDRLEGDSGNDSLSGGNGNDNLKGESGKDKLNGGDGRDRMSGGSGRDSCTGGNGKDRATCERKRRI